MSEFNYPLKCTFCEKKVGSTKCLLPFQFVNDFTLPSESFDAIMEVTEIHVSYGIQNLLYNKQLLEWFPNHHSDEGTSQRSGVLITGNFTLTYSISGSERSVTNYSEKGSQTDPEREDTLVSEVRPQDTRISKTHKIDEPERGIMSWADKVNESQIRSQSEGSSEILSIKDKGSSPTEISKQIRINEVTTLLSIESQNHLIQDLLLTMKCSYIIHVKQRSNIKITKLIASLDYETNLRNIKGKEYKPNYSTPLDGEIALSKEIVARHTPQQIVTWESRQAKVECVKCILETDSLQISNEDLANARIEEVLIEFVRTIRNSKTIPKGQLNTIFNAVRFELTRQDSASAYDWIMNMIKIKPKLIIAKQSTTPIMPSSSRLGVDARRKPLPDNIDDRFMQFIDNQLNPIIVDLIKSENVSFPTKTGGIEVSQYLRILVSDFIKRNKGWRNKNSFTTPNHLTKMIENTGLDFDTSESLTTFNCLKTILDLSRDKFISVYIPVTQPES